MLELSYNQSTKVYESPCHLKANNGIYLIDDFGRQRMTPADLLNRWIVPMESRIDHLTLPTGGKLSVPFETFLIFSTNLNPQKLGDEAFLRRIQYKMFVPNPDHAEFSEIFKKVCADCRLDIPDELLAALIERWYVRTGKEFRRCHPRDVISHAIDLIRFRRQPYQLTHDILDHAFISCFAEGNLAGHDQTVRVSKRRGRPPSELPGNYGSGQEDPIRLVQAVKNDTSRLV